MNTRLRHQAHNDVRKVIGDFGIVELGTMGKQRGTPMPVELHVLDIYFNTLTSGLSACVVSMFLDAKPPGMQTNQATGYASQHIWCLSQARINWEGCARNGIWHKNGGDGRDRGTN